MKTYSYMIKTILLVLVLVGCHKNDPALSLNEFLKQSLYRVEYADMKIEIVQARRSGVNALFVLYEHRSEKWGYELKECGSPDLWRSVFGVHQHKAKEIDVVELVEYGFDGNGFRLQDITLSCARPPQDIPLENELLIDSTSNHFYVNHNPLFMEEGEQEGMSEKPIYYSIPSECVGLVNIFDIKGRFKVQKKIEKKIIETEEEMAERINGEYRLVGCLDPGDDTDTETETEDGGIDYEDNMGVYITSVQDFAISEWHIESPVSGEKIYDLLFLVYPGETEKNTIYLPIYRINGEKVYDIHQTDGGYEKIERAVADAFDINVGYPIKEKAAFELYQRGALFRFPVVELCIGECDFENFSPAHFSVTPAEKNTGRVVNAEEVISKLVENKRGGSVGQVRSVWEYQPKRQLGFRNAEKYTKAMGLTRQSGAVKSWSEWAESEYAAKTLGKQDDIPLFYGVSNICRKTITNESELREALQECKGADEAHFEIADDIVVDEGSIKIEGSGISNRIRFISKDKKSLTFKRLTTSCLPSWKKLAAIALCDPVEVEIDNLNLLADADAVKSNRNKDEDQLEEVQNANGTAFVQINRGFLKMTNSIMGNESDDLGYGIIANESTVGMDEVEMHTNWVGIYTSESDILGSKLVIENGLSSRNTTGGRNGIESYLSKFYFYDAKILSRDPVRMKSTQVKGRFVELLANNGGDTVFRVYSQRQDANGNSIPSYVELYYPTISQFSYFSEITDEDAVIKINMPFAFNVDKKRFGEEKGRIEIR